MGKYKFVVDSSAVSYYVWGRIFGIDESKNIITGVCKPYKEEGGINYFLCRANIDNNRFRDFILSENELNTAKHIFDFKKQNNAYVFIVPPNKLNKIKNTIVKLINTCSVNDCYVAPDVGVAFKDGRIVNLFTLSLNNRIVSRVPLDKAYNQYLMEFINHYSKGVLVDRDLINLIGKDKYEVLKSNLLRAFGKIEVDNKNIFRPLIKIKNDKVTVLVDLSTGDIIYKGNRISLTHGKAEEMVADVLKEAGIELQKVHEALKRIKNYDIVNKKMKKFYPESAVVDVYLMAIAHDDVKVITEDNDIRGIKVIVEPIEVSNVELA